MRMLAIVTLANYLRFSWHLNLHDKSSIIRMENFDDARHLVLKKERTCIQIFRSSVSGDNRDQNSPLYNLNT